MAGGLYLDYGATAPLRDGVPELVTEVMGQTGNASSVHGFGRAARARLEKARERIAALAGTQSQQVLFTSGATESNNMVVQAFRGERILVSAVEHASVFESAPDAEIIPVTRDGVVDIAAFENMIDRGPPPALIAVMMVNNETGAIQPVEKLVKLAKAKHPPVHFLCDAVQAAGKMPLDFQALRLDYMSLAGHKMGGPQGVGALIAAPGAKPVKLLHGAAQENRQRAGTENIAAIAGFGLAADLAREHMDHYKTLAAWRDRMESRMLAAAPHLVILGKGAPRTGNVSTFALPGVPSQTQIMALDLDGIAVSGGSACASGTVKPSRTALAMGYPEDIAKGLIRVSMGWHTKESDIDRFLASWTKIAQRLKEKACA